MNFFFFYPPLLSSLPPSILGLPEMLGKQMTSDLVTINSWVTWLICEDLTEKACSDLVFITYQTYSASLLFIPAHTCAPCIVYPTFFSTLSNAISFNILIIWYFSLWDEACLEKFGSAVVVIGEVSERKGNFCFICI